jgi:hypothetical protein
MLRLTLVALLGVFSAAPVGWRAHADPPRAARSVRARALPLLTSETKLAAADAAALDDFGFAVAASTDTLVVGAPGDDCAVPGLDQCGAAYVFVRAGTSWIQQQKLVAGDAAAGDSFGYSVAVDGDTVVVGAQTPCAAGDYCGSAYVFVREGTVWTEQQKLVASDPARWDFFGVSVSVSGDTAVVGADQDDCGAGDYCGSAYVFVREGTVWTEQQKLVASDPSPSEYFGHALALSGDTVIVGAYGVECAGPHSHCGAAYVFERTGTAWSLQQTLTAIDTDQGDYLGSSVALSGDTAVVGAFGSGCVLSGSACGAAYVFVREGSGWIEQQKLVHSGGSQIDYFGWSVAVSGETAIVGAYFDDGCDVSGDGCGAAYVFGRTGTVWNERQKLTGSDRAARDYFGWSVASSGNTALAGARWGDGTSEDCGAAYVHEPSDSLFADDFDSGTLAAWTAAATDGGDLSVTTGAGVPPMLAFANYGLQAVVNDRNPLFVEDHTPSGELRYRVKFWLNPQTFDPGEAQSHFRVRLMLGIESEPLLRRQFAVVLKRQGGNDSLLVRTTRADGTRVKTGPLPLSPGWHSVELDWQRSSAAGLRDGSMTVWLDEVLQERVTGIDTGMHGIDFVRFGPTNLKSGSNGTLYLDRFESRRLSRIQ